MAGIVAIIVKVMPESHDVNLKTVKEKAEKILTKKGAKNISSEEKPIAFGLKALFVKFAWPEEEDTEIIENVLKELKGVSSVDIEDYRRVFG